MRYWLVLLLFMSSALSAGNAAAQDKRVDALNSAMKCAEVADDAERLRCYDAAMGRLKEAIEVTPQEQVAAFGKPGEDQGGGFSVFGLTLWGQAQTPEQFGAEQVARANPTEGLDEITAKVVDYAYTPLGMAIMFLDNGQVWRQTDGRKIKFSRDPEKRIVTIKTGIMGSYRLTVGDLNRTYTVRREK